MKRGIKFILLFINLIFLLNLIAATDCWAAPLQAGNHWNDAPEGWGNDSNSGLDSSNPKTLLGCRNAIDPGETIYLLPGHYDMSLYNMLENVSDIYIFDANATLETPENYSKAVLDGTYSTSDRSILRFANHGGTIKRIVFQNAGNGSRYGIDLRKNITIIDSEFYNNLYDLYIIGPNINITLERNKFVRTKGVSIFTAVLPVLLNTKNNIFLNSKIFVDARQETSWYSYNDNFIGSEEDAIVINSNFNGEIIFYNPLFYGNANVLSSFNIQNSASSGSVSIYNSARTAADFYSVCTEGVCTNEMGDSDLYGNILEVGTIFNSTQFSTLLPDYGVNPVHQGYVTFRSDDVVTNGNQNFDDYIKIVDFMQDYNGEISPAVDVGQLLNSENASRYIEQLKILVSGGTYSLDGITYTITGGNLPSLHSLSHHIMQMDGEAILQVKESASADGNTSFVIEKNSGFDINGTDVIRVSIEYDGTGAFSTVFDLKTENLSANYTNQNVYYYEEVSGDNLTSLNTNNSNMGTLQGFADFVNNLPGFDAQLPYLSSSIEFPENCPSRYLVDVNFTNSDLESDWNNVTENEQRVYYYEIKYALETLNEIIGENITTFVTPYNIGFGDSDFLNNATYMGIDLVAIKKNVVNLAEVHRIDDFGHIAVGRDGLDDYSDIKINNSVKNICSTLTAIGGHTGLYHHAFTDISFSVLKKWIQAFSECEGVSMVTVQELNDLLEGSSWENNNTRYKRISWVDNNSTLKYNSPLIDAGIENNMSRDFLGNPIYGQIDIGAFEYQPPYNISEDSVEMDSSIRIYSDGKYRYKNRTSSFDSGNKTFVVLPEENYQNHSSTQKRNSSYDVQFISWSESGITFNISNLSSSGNVNFTICNLSSSSSFNYYIDDSLSTSFSSDSNGCVDFQYTGNWSEHKIVLEKNVTVEQTEESTSSGGGSPIYYPNTNQLKEGYKKIFRKNWELKFKLEDSTHSLKVNDIFEDKVLVTVSSDPITFNLSLGEIKKVDVDSDGYYDISVYLEDIRGIYADIVTTVIDKEKVEEKEIIEEGINNIDSDVPIVEKESFNFVYYILGFVLILLIVLIFVFRKYLIFVFKRIIKN